MHRHPMTPEGEKALRDELNYRKKTARSEITRAISEARAHGDLRENAEYNAAREQQGFNEGRIQDLEAKLNQSCVIDITRIENTGKVVFGATVTLVNEDDKTESRYRIVGEDEASVSEGKLSYASPLARAMISKEEGDIVRIDTIKNSAEYRIEAVEHIGHENMAPQAGVTENQDLHTS